MKAAIIEQRQRPVLEAYRRGGLIVHLMIIFGLLLIVVGVLGLFFSWFVGLTFWLIISGLCLLAAAIAWVEFKRRST